MKIGMFSPYVPKHFGGGEKYFFDVARVLAEEGHQVEIGVLGLGQENTKITEKFKDSYEQFLNVSLDTIKFVPTPIGSGESVLKKLRWTRQYDVLYYLTDGSLFFSAAKKNILHIQFPFRFSKTSPVDRLKLKNWQVINANSAFTKRVIEKNWRVPVPFIHYPMIDSACFQPIQKKEKVILHVGRFFRQLHSKRQDVLVDIFRQLKKEHGMKLRGWKMVMIGSVEDAEYAREVATAAQGLPITILHTAKRKELLEWLARASVYWHATGYQIDEEQYPEKTEHFGISTAEAMASGCVPIVLGKGGQPEVVGDALKHLLWQTKEDCMTRTLEVIQDSQKLLEYSKVAQDQVTQFGEERFRSMLLEMITR